MNDNMFATLLKDGIYIEMGIAGYRAMIKQQNDTEETWQAMIQQQCDVPLLEYKAQ